MKNDIRWIALGLLAVSCQPVSLLGSQHALSDGGNTCQLQPDPAGPCNGGQCQAGEVCVNGNCFDCLNGDCSGCGNLGGTDGGSGSDSGSQDSGVCQAIGAVCTAFSDCCSQNCNFHSTPATCCVAGGCP
jgi:hypothetical protein